MRLVEDNVRAHIHSDVIIYLTEEGMNKLAHPPSGVSHTAKSPSPPIFLGFEPPPPRN